MKSLLVDFNVKLGREDNFKPTIGNENLRQDRSDNVVRNLSFATSKKCIFKSRMFLHQNIHKYIGNSPDGNTTRLLTY